ncbi:hypothetical protein NHX12_017932, partial [Muraenolepis orangiensis]
MLPCNHDEAKTRIVTHLLDALEHGSSTCLEHTVDTDVVVILIGKFYALLNKYTAADIWVAFGTGKNDTYHINTICHTLGKDRSTALPVFHCYTSCDTTSAFCRKGKRSAWNAWNSYPEGHYKAAGDIPAALPGGRGPCGTESRRWRAERVVGAAHHEAEECRAVLRQQETELARLWEVLRSTEQELDERVAHMAGIGEKQDIDT